ncbi:MAG: hypothetical protein WAK33_04295 [Silvibacterium sp.]
MMKIVKEIAANASQASVRETENLAIDSPPDNRDIRAYAQAVIPNSAIQAETVQPTAVPTTIRIHLDVESLIKHARNEDEQLAIIAAIHRFYAIALLGSTDRRYVC